MKAEYLKEPYLFFGEGKSICPREGIAGLKVYDTVQTARKDQLLIGIVGIEEDIENLKGWLKRFESFVPANPNGKQKGLFKSFPGFNQDQGFCAKFIYDTNYERILSPNDIDKALDNKVHEKQVFDAVELFAKNIQFLSDIKNCDVVICVVPKSFEGKIVKENKDEEPVERTAEDNELPEMEANFRRALKAKSMQYNTPIQLIREYVLHDDKKSQDTATKAWNLCTALYYKGLQTIPWKLEVDENRPKVCYVGIGFYRSRDKKTIQTSLAQIFNENGKGVILRGTPVVEDKDDRKPHLTYEQSYSLLKDALIKYKFATGTVPGRVVLHKTSKYYEDELDGFEQVFKEMSITEYDVVTVMETDLRFFRNALYPPVRGSLFTLTEERYVLYTRGSVHQYQTYLVMHQILLRENKIRRNQEHFWVVGLDNINKILFIELIGLGAVNRVAADPPDVFRMGIYKLAVSMILVHNHPSGEVKPSKTDKDFTDRMLKVGKLINIDVIDHLVISEKTYTSFKDEGIMKELSKSGLFEIVEREKWEIKEWKLQMERERGANEELLKVAKKLKVKGEDEKYIKEITGLHLSTIRSL